MKCRSTITATLLMLLGTVAGCNNNQATTMPDTPAPLPGKPSSKDLARPSPPSPPPPAPK